MEGVPFLPSVNCHLCNFLKTKGCLFFQSAHGAEILTLSFTSCDPGACKRIAKNGYYLASGGRDCIINLYDVERYVLLML